MTHHVAAGARDLDEIAERSKLSGTVLVTWGDQGWEHGDVDAHYVTYSLTKSVMLAAVLLLAGDGTLDLEMPVAAALDDDRFDATLAQLLAHVGGIADYGPLPAYNAAVYSCPSQPWSDEMILDQVLAEMPDVTTGRGWAYSNTGYMFVRRVLDNHGGLTSLLPALGFTTASVADDCRASITRWHVDELPGTTLAAGRFVYVGIAPRQMAFRASRQNLRTRVRYHFREVPERPSPAIPPGPRRSDASRRSRR